MSFTQAFGRLALALVLLLLLSCCGAAEEVNTSARACIIIDEATGRVLLQHNADEPLPMASTTKVMTALLAIELGDMDAPVTASRNAFGVPGTNIYLSEGETLTLQEMLTGLMLSSGNDAAVAIAEHIGGTVSNFCRMMTERAAALGCTSTVFLTPHGLPQEGHHTTARDLALIARAAMAEPIFRDIVSTKRATIPWEGHDYARVLTNKNQLLSTYAGATGIKTGYTKKAGRCLVFGAERDGMRIIGVVLNCPDWFNEAARLMDIAFERYEAVTLAQAGDVLATMPVNRTDGATVDLCITADLTGIAPRGSIPRIELYLPDAPEAPITAGQLLGTARLVCGGETIAEVPLAAAQTVLRDDFPARWRMYWQNWLLLP